MTPERIGIVMACAIFLLIVTITCREIDRYLSRKHAPLPVGKEGASGGESVREGSKLELVSEPGRMRQEFDPQDWIELKNTLSKVLSAPHIASVQVEMADEGVAKLTIEGRFTPLQAVFVLQEAGRL